MKLMFVIVKDTDDEQVVKAIVREGYRVTRVASTGGFLRRGNITLMIGVEEENVDNVCAVLRQSTSPSDTAQHRATIFVVDMPHYEQI